MSRRSKEKSSSSITTELKTPAEWEVVFDLIIYDPDGWRRDGKSYDDPISKEEFRDRMWDSTIGPSPAKLDKARDSGYNERPERYGSNDANGWRSGPAEYDYMHRYDSPDNERDSMG